jgi:isoamylase
VRAVIALRRAHPVLRRRRFFAGRKIRGEGVQDIAWFDPSGVEMTDAGWASEHVRCIGVKLSGDAIAETNERGERIIDDTLLILFNAHDATVPFTLPGADEPAEWTAILDTARVSREHRRLASGDQYLLESRSLALLRLRR